MSIFHCSVKSGSKAGGGKAAKSAGSKEDYLKRNGKYKDHDTCRFSENGNMPNWAAETSYWKSADAYERKNGTLFREVEVAIPRELNIEQQNDLAKSFAWRIAAVDSGDLPYTLAVHEGRGTNPHVHIILSERINDGHDRTPETWFKRAANTGKDQATGGARKADLGGDRKNWLLDVRQTWEKMANEALAKAGHNIQIDHRTLKEQGIDRAPGKHLGVNAAAVERKTGQKSERRLWIEQKMAQYKPIKAEKRTFYVPFAEKNEAKALGAKWDKEAKTWHAPDGVDIERFRKWTHPGEKAPETAKKPPTEREKVNQAFNELLRPKEPEKPVLRQKEKEPLPGVRSGESPGQAEERLLSGYFADLLGQWRDTQAKKHSEQWKGYMARASELRASEPKKPRLIGVKQWESDHQDWERDLSETDRLATYHKLRCEKFLKGELDHDSRQELQHQAKRQLEVEYPQLVKAAAVEREQRQAEQKAEQLKKMLERKQEQSNEQDKGWSR